ncbi:hypothetical protein Barb6_02293 [Bacteroidales bacterium Barb6]|nr:hypothetical protein Barb6_02293 [Bacteroidales bacterium Barb6]
MVFGKAGRAVGSQRSRQVVASFQRIVHTPQQGVQDRLRAARNRSKPLSCLQIMVGQLFVCIIGGISGGTLFGRSLGAVASQDINVMVVMHLFGIVQRIVILPRIGTLVAHAAVALCKEAGG